ncbi:MAG: hypothetical protein L6R35_006274 [Caloplaca aegaea]|nr:MAG: hypothetical protein L6R35_006274 [Caloplaca aegaea]
MNTTQMSAFPFKIRSMPESSVIGTTMSDFSGSKNDLDQEAENPFLPKPLFISQNQNNEAARILADPVFKTLNSQSAATDMLSPFPPLATLPNDQAPTAGSPAFNKGQGPAKEEGPLLLALLMGNNNNNNAAQKAASKPVPDSLASQIAAIELLPASGSLKYSSADRAATDKSIILKHSLDPGTEGPLILGLMLANNNNNNPAQANRSLDPIPDALAAQSAAVELLPAAPAPLHLKLRGHAATPFCFNGELDAAQMRSWFAEGYLVIPNAVSNIAAEGLCDTVEEMVADIFATGRAHSLSDVKSLNPNPMGRIFASITPSVPTDKTLQPIQRIQRLGCGIHRLSPRFRALTFSAANAKIAEHLGLKNPRVVMSQIVPKAAGKGAVIVPHQDAQSNFEPMLRGVTFWYALQDADRENGCLCVVPGSHRTVPLQKRCIIDSSGAVVFVDLEMPLLPSNLPDAGVETKQDRTKELVYEKLEVRAGTLVLMHSNLMHTSAANGSDRGRVAYNFGVAEGECEWPKDNYLQPYEGEREFERLRPI